MGLWDGLKKFGKGVSETTGKVAAGLRRNVDIDRDALIRALNTGNLELWRKTLADADVDNPAFHTKLGNGETVQTQILKAAIETHSTFEAQNEFLKNHEEPVKKLLELHGIRQDKETFRTYVHLESEYFLRHMDVSFAHYPHITSETIKDLYFDDALTRHVDIQRLYDYIKKNDTTTVPKDTENAQGETPLKLMKKYKAKKNNPAFDSFVLMQRMLKKELAQKPGYDEFMTWAENENFYEEFPFLEQMAAMSRTKYDNKFGNLTPLHLQEDDDVPEERWARPPEPEEEIVDEDAPENVVAFVPASPPVEETIELEVILPPPVEVEEPENELGGIEEITITPAPVADETPKADDTIEAPVAEEKPVEVADTTPQPRLSVLIKQIEDEKKIIQEKKAAEQAALDATLGQEYYTEPATAGDADNAGSDTGDTNDTHVADEDDNKSKGQPAMQVNSGPVHFSALSKTVEENIKKIKAKEKEEAEHREELIRQKNLEKHNAMSEEERQTYYSSLVKHLQKNTMFIIQKSVFAPPKEQWQKYGWSDDLQKTLDNFKEAQKQKHQPLVKTNTHHRMR